LIDQRWYRRFGLIRISPVWCWSNDRFTDIVAVTWGTGKNLL